MARYEIPLLRTERLVLRALEPADLDAFARMQANPAVMRTLGTGVTRTRAETWDSMARTLGQWALRGYGMFALEEAATGDWIGRAGLLHPHDWEGPELAYGLDQPYWGQGFATEAASAIHRWAFTALRLPSLVSYVLPGNAASVRVLAKLGARPAGRVRIMGDIEADRFDHVPPG